jgi:hypothetical protein
MNTTHLETVWAPRLLSILRIVAALIFMAHGTQKLLGFPISPNPGPAAFSLPWIAGVLELVGGALLIPGLFVRPVAFILSGLLDRPRPPQPLSRPERRRRGNPVLLRVPVHCGRRGRRVEPGSHSAQRSRRIGG